MEPASPHIARSVAARDVHFRGFTLMEVMVSTSILVLIIVMLSQMLWRVSNICQQGHAIVERSEEGMAVLEFMTKELQGALLPATGTSINSLQLFVNPQLTPPLDSKYLNRDAIFWQAPLATDHSMGDIAEVGYFVKWDTTSKPNNPRAMLCRFFVPPIINGSPNTNYLINTHPEDWLNNDIINVVAPGNTAPYQGLFIENVIALWITCLAPSGNKITVDADGAAFAQNSFDSRRGYKYTDSDGTVVKKIPCSLPAAVDVSFVLIDSNSANRVTSSLKTAIGTLAASASNANDFVGAATANKAFKPILSGLRPYTTRVYLYNSK